MKAYEITLVTELTPGNASFNNYDEVKQYLQSELMAYNNTSYSMDNIDQAMEDFVVLKAVRKRLTSKRKELEKAYTMPIEEVMSQLDELIEMVKVPYTVVDRFLKAHEKDIKEREILAYARVKSEALGIYSDKVVESSAFFNPRWLNKTYTDKQWKSDVDQKIQSAFNDIKLIKSLGGEHENALLAFYFDKLSMNGVEAFLETLTGQSEKEPESVEVEYIPEPELNIDPETGEILDDWNEDEGKWENPTSSEPMNPNPVDTNHFPEAETPLSDQKDQKDIVEIIVRLKGPKESVLDYKRAAFSYGVSIEDIEIERVAANPNRDQEQTISNKPQRMEDGLNRRGAPWDAAEDEALKSEFASGMTISESSKVHGRTTGAIRARLLKLGLIEK